MSKRNQKRIEHELKDLINDRSNANKCGECGAGFPSMCYLCILFWGL